MKPANIRNSLSGLLLLCAMAVSLAGCAAPRTADTHTQAIDAQADESQTSGLTGAPAHGSTPAKKPDETFVSSQMRFAVSLFQQAAAAGGENVLISPLSVRLALAMTANGAGGQTLAEMEALLAAPSRWRSSTNSSAHMSAVCPPERAPRCTSPTRSGTGRPMG